MTLLGLLLLGFLAQLTVLGALRHGRDQEVAYDALRLQLAEATAPVGAYDDSGRLVADGAPVGLLSVPRLGLREVVLAGTSPEVTRSGPGWRRDSPLPGQPGRAVLQGRRAGYGGPFADLARLAPGDEVRVLTGQGDQVFRVTGVRTDRDPAPALEGAQLALVTAGGAPLAPQGTVVVDAALVGAPAAAAPRGPAPRAAELPLAGDSTAAYPLVLLAQALLLAVVLLTWARARWGRRQAWLVGVPVLTFLVLSTGGTAARLLPNLL